MGKIVLLRPRSVVVGFAETLLVNRGDVFLRSPARKPLGEVEKELVWVK